MKEITQLSRFKIRWLNARSLILLLGVFFTLLEGNAQTYCTPTYTYNCGSGDDFNSFKITGHGTSVINDLNTGCTASGYLDNSTSIPPVDLMQSQSYQVELNTTYSSPTSEKASIWIDFNNDGTFDDATEKLLTDLPLAQSPAFATSNIAIPLNASPGIRRMRVRVVWSTTGVNACNNASYGETHDYSVNILALPACSGTPTAGTAVATPAIRTCASQPFTLSATGATIAGNMTYQWESSPAGANNFSPISGANTVTHTVTSQTGDTDYRFVVNCTTSNSGNTSNVITMVQPAAASVFYENFDTTPTGSSSNNTVPSCWTYLKIGTSSSFYGYTDDIAGQTGNGFYAYRSSTASATGDLLLISPQTDNLGAGTKQIRFSAKRRYSGSYGDTLRVYTMDGTTATSVKTLITEIKLDPNAAWNEYIVPLANTTDDYFAFSFDQEGMTKYVFIDDVYYEDLSPCIFPIGLNVTNVTSNSADISWNASLATGVTGYYYEVRDNAGTVMKSGTVTGTSESIVGLIPGTSYTVYIRSVCGASNGDWTMYPVEFTTLCVPILVNFHESFDNTATGDSSDNTVPNCWTYIKTGSSSSFYGYTTTTATQTAGGKGFYTYRPAQSGTTYNGDLMLVSPETANLGSGTKQMRFSTRRRYTGSYSGELKIYTMSDKTAAATKTLIATINLPADILWHEYIIPLPNTTDDYFAFSFEQESLTKYIFIDEVYYEDLSPCMYPGNIGAINVTATGATINWDSSLAAGVTGYDWEVRDMNGTVIKSGTKTGVNSTSASVTGLNPGNYYFVYVRSKCGASTGDWTAIPAKFATLCATITGNLFEGFESTPTGGSTNASEPLCWTYLKVGSSTSFYGYTYDQASKTGNNGFYGYRSSSTSASGDLLLISPETANLGNGEKRLRFSAKRRYSGTSYTGNLSIYTMNGTTSSATKTLVTTINLPDNASWDEYIVYLPQTTDDYFAFSFDQGSATNYTFLDDIYYEDIPPLLVDVTKTDILCYGANSGTAVAVPEGGKPPYTYSWSPSGATTDQVSNLIPGPHTLTVTDDRGKTVTATITITQPSQVVSGLQFTSVSCNGMNDGVASVNPSGGVAPYTVLWSDNAVGNNRTKLVPGAYTVTIRDANYCVLTESFTIAEPLILTTAIGSQTNVTTYGGNDGSATIAVTGGTAPYTYSWSPSGGSGATASNLAAGTYTVLVTDARGCTTAQSVVITQPAPPYEIVLVSKNDISCNGSNDGSITVTVTGGTAPYTYSWSPSAGNSPSVSNLPAGVYTLTVTDADSSIITKSFTILEPAVLSGSMTTIVNVGCSGQSNGSATVTASGGTAPYTYLWSNGMTTATATNLIAANYSVTVTDSNGCSVTVPVSITQGAVLNLNGTKTDISCFGLNDGSIALNVTGGLAPYTYNWSNSQTASTLTNLSKGTYTVTVTDSNNCTEIRSFTIAEPAFVHPPVATNQVFCLGQNSQLSDIVIAGSNIKWYDAPTAGALLPSNTVLTNGTTYYASQTTGVCESSRTAVQITLSQGTPLTTNQLNVCGNTRVQNMNVDGLNYTQLKWFDTATSTTPLAASQLLTTKTYYVSSVVGNCESARQPIQVTVAAAVGVPGASAQTVCGNTTLNDLTVTKDPGALLKWYSSLQSMTPLAGTTVVSSGTYYVQQVVGGCESSRVAVSVQVIQVSAPSMTSISTCAGVTIADFNTPTNNYVWYTDSTTTTALPATHVVTTGTYYIAEELSGCISSRTSVSVVVNARPSSPSGPSKQMFNYAATVSDIQMNQPNVIWFASYQDALMQLNPLPGTTRLQTGTTYYGILTGANNCGSLPAAVEVTVVLSTAELDLAQLRYYPNPADSELNISYIEAITKVEVFSITGQKVMSNDFSSNTIKVNLSTLSSGTYMVRIETETASQFIKIVKR